MNLMLLKGWLYYLRDFLTVMLILVHIDVFKAINENNKVGSIDDILFKFPFVLPFGKTERRAK